MRIVAWCLAAALALRLLDRLALRAERRGWIYYRKRRARPGSDGNALLAALALCAVGAGAGEPGPPVNWALGAPARQSSTRSGCEAARAVDGAREGDRAARSVALTKSAPDSFWEVDLGAVREVEEIRVFLCHRGCGARLRDLAVFVSEEPFRHVAARETMLQLGVSFALVWGPLGDPADDGGRTERQTIPIRARGRWVRLQPVEGGPLALAEVEVLGPPPPGG